MLGKLQTFPICLFIVAVHIIISTDIAFSAEPDHGAYGMSICANDTASIEIKRQGDEVAEYVYKFHYGLCAGGGTLLPQHNGFWFFGLKAGRYYPRLRVWSDYGLLYMQSNLSETSNPVVGTNNEWELAHDINVRYYFTPSHTFMGLHADAGGRLGILIFKRAVSDMAEDDEDGTAFCTDAIGTTSIYDGLGTSFLQTKRLHLSGTLTTGIKFFFSNSILQPATDLFDTQGFVQFVVDVTFMSQKKSTTSHHPMH